MHAGTKIAAISATIGLSFFLTACDPPMPEDMKIALAEQTVLCESGTVSIQIPESIAELGLGWADAMSLGCPDMALNLTNQLKEPSGLVISDPDPKQNVFLKVPFALDAAVLVVNITDVFEIYLSAETISQIFAGKITSWNDPKILADNSGIDLPNLKIILPKEATAVAKTSFSNWIEILTGSPLNLEKIADAKISEVELATPVKNGSISLASYSAATYSGSTIAAVLTEPGNIDTAILSATDTIHSAATQLVTKAEGDSINLKLDPKLTPIAPEGSVQAAMPYQAIYPVDLNFIGEDSALVRTAGRFLLRQESQGVITSGTMLPVPEAIRILSVKVIEKGLAKTAQSETE